MKKSDIIKLLSKKFPEVSKREISKVVEEIFDELIRALSRGERVEIRGLGTFEVREKKADKLEAKNAVNGKVKFIRFKQSKLFKDVYKGMVAVFLFSISCLADTGQLNVDDNYSKIVQSFENRKKIEIQGELGKVVVNENKVKCLEKARSDFEVRRCKERFD